MKCIGYYMDRYSHWAMRLLVLVLALSLAFPLEAARRKKARTRRTSSTQTHQPDTPVGMLDEAVAGAIRHGEQLLGKPYRTRGIAPWALDCSGYVSYIFGLMGVNLPRGSASLSQFTDRTDDPQPGDLAFFRGRNASSRRVGHVALVVERIGDDMVIMHSTNSRGIIKHRLSRDAYFSSRYLFSGRIPELAQRIRAAAPTEPQRLSPLAPEHVPPTIFDEALKPTLPEWPVQHLSNR